MKLRIMLALPAVTLLAACSTLPPPPPGECALARLYIEASNSGDAARIEPWLAEDVTAVFLPEGAPEDGSEASMISGRQAVLEAVSTYTAQCASCRSRSVCLHESDRAIYAIEHVVFVDQDGVERQQSAPLVLEIDAGRIHSIIYYPANHATD